MNTRKSLIAIGGSLLLGTATVANAESNNDDLRQEIAALRARLAEVEGRQNENWLSERRAEEVKALVQEVLADADTRATLMADGMYSGYTPGKGFHLSSEDGSTTLNLTALAQIRYIYNSNSSSRPIAASSGVPTGPAVDNEIGGFEVARGRIGLDGTVDKLSYGMVLEAGTVNTGVLASGVSLLDAWAAYDVADNVNIKAGRFKAGFSRLDSIDASNLLAVERSGTTEAFAVGRVEGVELSYTMDNITASIGLNDGLRSGEVFDPYTGNKSFASPDVDYSFTARVDVQVMGDAADVQDYGAIEGQALSVGGGLHYQQAESIAGNASSTLAPVPVVGVSGADVFLWVIDAMFKQDKMVATLALSGAHRNPDAPLPGDVAGSSGHQENTYAVSLEGGYWVTDQLQPFFRYEWLFGDAVNRTIDNNVLAGPFFAGDIHVLTVGANYEISEAAKFTADVVWGIGPNGSGALVGAGVGPGLGLVGANNDEIALRAQLQLAF